MIVVALILIVVCAVVILGVLFGDPSAVVDLNFFDIESFQVTSIEAFFVGLTTGVVSLLSLWLLLTSLRRARQKAVERRAMEKRHQELEKEKAELEDKLGREEDPDRPVTYDTTRQDPDPR
jgi:hypothetical protein